MEDASGGQQIQALRGRTNLDAASIAEGHAIALDAVAEDYALFVHCRCHDQGVLRIDESFDDVSAGGDAAVAQC